MDHHCTRTDSETELLLELSESLDVLTVPVVSPIFDAVVADRPRRVVVDLENLTQIDSSGVGALVSLFRRVKANDGDFVVLHAREQPRLVLELLKLDVPFGLAPAA